METLSLIWLTFAAGLAMGGGGVTAEFKFNYLRHVIGERSIARAKTLSVGRTQGVSRCEVYIVADRVEDLCAAAQL